MLFSAISLQGNILSGEILEKIRNEDLKFQKPKDFGLDAKASLRDEIGVAWSAARAHWQAFSVRRERLGDSDSGITETRSSWIMPLLLEFGYELNKAKAEIIDEKSYAISHRDENRDGFPVHIVGVNQSLDKRADFAGYRLSPHALVQEYLNNHDHLYALVTNGARIRLLRDATLLSKLSYLEFDLERIMDEELYNEFALMYRILHVSRMPKAADEGENSIVEYYRQHALDSGSRIREKLSAAVEQALQILANGFLERPENFELRESAKSGDLPAKEFYSYLLRTVYRTLFLVVVESRNLIFSNNPDEETDRLRKIYFDYYSVKRLMRLAERRIFVEGDKIDLFRALVAAFSLFEKGIFGEKLGIAPLGYGLFDPGALGNLPNQEIENEPFLRALDKLAAFVDDNDRRVRVNYADLDVEEFGSVYESLLEYEPKYSFVGESVSFGFVKGDERASGGSHYTPEELVKPLIDNSLKHIIREKLREAKNISKSPLSVVRKDVGELRQTGGNPSAVAHTPAEAALLSIKIIDAASGSGHILLSAARTIGLELARVRTGEDQPSPPEIRRATRDAILNCVYGVDVNPGAVELCKIALWLEAHNPGEPLNFLDAKIREGDAVVGLARAEELADGVPNEAFKKTPEDEPSVASKLAAKNKADRRERDEDLESLDFEQAAEEPLQRALERFAEIAAMPQSAPDEIRDVESEYFRARASVDFWKLKSLADMRTAPFFIAKTADNEAAVPADSDFRAALAGRTNLETSPKAAAARAVAAKKKFFHWFLEFPQIMAAGGFDLAIGNPPFLGGQRITGTYGHDYANWLLNYFSPAKSCDYVAFFFRRTFSIIKNSGFLSLISTNTIAQGTAREVGLEEIINRGGSINGAIRSRKWPGKAAVNVSLISIFKGEWRGDFMLNEKPVERITSYLDDAEDLGNPFKLKQNANKSFQGSIVLGKGFVLEPEHARDLINKNPKNKDVLFPYLNGQDLNSNYDQSPSRWVINFFDWPEEKCKEEYPDCYEIIERDVKPERTRWKKDNDGNEIEGTYALRKPLPQKWWIYGEKRPALYRTIAPLKRVLVISRVTKLVLFSYQETDRVYSEATVVVALEKAWQLLILTTNFHNDWAWRYSSTMGAQTVRYSGTGAFETFPFPQDMSGETEAELEAIGEDYHEFRRELMSRSRLGLTKLYNQFHNADLERYDPDDAESAALAPKAFQKKFGKQTYELLRHLDSQPDAPDFAEFRRDVLRLRELHRRMDEAALRAYGWEDVPLEHDFYEIDYLPENDRVRYSISPAARREVLKRLLLLNHKIYEEEKSGKRAKSPKDRTKDRQEEKLF